MTHFNIIKIRDELYKTYFQGHEIQTVHRLSKNYSEYHKNADLGVNVGG